MLDTVGAPLALSDFAEHHRTLIEDLIDDAVFSTLFEVLERVLS